MQNKRTALLVLWAVLICCVVIGSLLPAANSVMVAIGRLHIWDKLQHFGAYLALSFLPVIGFRDRRRGLMAGLSMFLPGALMEACRPAPSGTSLRRSRSSSNLVQTPSALGAGGGTRTPTTFVTGT